jgi:peptidoglycan-N-acetylglucosamine deacetylase
MAISGRSAAVTAVAAAAGAVAHAGPGLLGLPGPRLRWAPRLAGLGRPGHLALTFDDGPEPRATPAVLEVLDRLGLRATFFMLGEAVRRNPSLAAEVVAAGHEPAVHGDTHASLLLTGPVATVDGLRRARDAIGAVTGVSPRWFRPAFGVLSGTAVLAAPRLGLRSVLWTAWGRDWEPGSTADTVLAEVARGVLDGGTLLLHDYSASGSWRATAAALPDLARLLDALRLTPGPLGEHGITGPGSAAA